MKQCTKCKIEKPISEFYVDKRDGATSGCKSCIKIRAKKYRDANPEKVAKVTAEWVVNNQDRKKATHAAWYAANAENVKAASKAWGLANKSKARAIGVAWRLNNPDRAKKNITEWHISNPDKRNIYSNNRRARKVSAGGKLSHGLVSRLFILQRGLCPCCKQPLGNDFHIDHIMPLKLGGSNTDENIQLLRKRCNQQKNASDPVDFMQSRGFLL
jgi:5-methylcytosine-specific restriction endonuclease McrA